MTTLIGETLRAARERQGLTLADAAASTRIRERCLQALEEEDFEHLHLGGDVYVRGFLRNYAKALGVDPEPVLAAYRERYEQQEPDEAALTGRVLAGEQEGLPRNVRLTAASATVIAVLALLVAIGQQEPGPTAAPPVETARPTPVEEPQEPQEPQEAAEAEQEVEPAPEREVADDAEGQTGPELSAEGLDVEVAIEGGASWLRVVVDGDLAFEGIQPADSRLNFSGEEEVLLRIGNAGAVSIMVNGEDHGLAGASGEVVEHSFRVDSAAST